MVKTQLSRKTNANNRRRSTRSNIRHGGKYGFIKFLNLKTGKLTSIEAPEDVTIIDLKNRIADKKGILDAKSIRLSFDLKDALDHHVWGELKHPAWWAQPAFDYEDKNAEEQQFKEGDDDY